MANRSAQDTNSQSLVVSSSDTIESNFMSFALLNSKDGSNYEKKDDVIIKEENAEDFKANVNKLVDFVDLVSSDGSLKTKVNMTLEISLEKVPQKDIEKLYKIKFKEVETKTCKICEKHFSDINSRRRHESIHHENSKSPHYCPFCEKEFREQKTLDRHCRTFHSNAPNICRIKMCKEEFDNYEQLNNHFTSEHSKKAYECDQCERNFLNKQNRTRHVMEFHQNNSKYDEIIEVSTESVQTSADNVNLEASTKHDNDDSQVGTYILT